MVISLIDSLPLMSSFTLFEMTLQPTLLAEPFLMVHMLCTVKRLCTSPVKFLIEHVQCVAK